MPTAAAIVTTVVISEAVGTLQDGNGEEHKVGNLVAVCEHGQHGCQQENGRTEIAVATRAVRSLMPFFCLHSHTHSPVLMANARARIEITLSLG